MSRIGKKPIQIPEGVTVNIKDGKIVVKGPKGELSQKIPSLVEISQSGSEIQVKPISSRKEARALWGTIRSLVANMVQGVSEGYEKRLQIEGVGYRAQLKGESLVLNIGFTNPVEIEPPAGIKFSVEKNIISVSGIDKAIVGEVAAKIRAVKKPEPYKGKGIRYEGEVVRRKAGKKAVGAGTE